jgi:hypoxanthine phosphoribosyltransferase
MQDYREFIQDVLIPENVLQERITELGIQIDRDYAGRDLHLICILRGGVLFLADLMRRITIPHTIDFMAVSSYGAGSRKTTGEVRITMDLKESIQGRNVLLVEDIVDSGYTIDSVLKLLETRNPHSLKVCTLLDKAERREVRVPIDYYGFVIPDKFVFGYGLDMDEYYRNLPFIGTVDASRYIPPEPLNAR